MRPCPLPGRAVLARTVHGLDAGEDEIDAGQELLAVVMFEQLQAFGVPEGGLPDSAGVLVNYILGVAGQNAANARALASSKMDRSTFLATVAAQWARLDPDRYPSMHRARTQLREHDDREQFLAGIDLILAGIETVNRVSENDRAR